jgi:iron complex transport system ATP-binding protein
MTGTPALALTDVTVRHDRDTMIGPVSFVVGTGTWLGLLGPNGAGKSSLLRAAVGLVRHGGTLSVDGRPVGTLSRRELARLVALVPQQPTVPADMTVAEYVLLGRTAFVPTFGWETDADHAAVDRALDRLDLAALAGRRLGAVSGGELQRAVLARAIAQEAPLLLLDEPTAALDLGHVQQVLELVDDLRHDAGPPASGIAVGRPITVVAAMHDLTLAAQFADDIVLLHRGVVKRHGSPADVLDASTIADVYGARVAVSFDGDRPVVTPTRKGR